MSDPTGAPRLPMARPIGRNFLDDLPTTFNEYMAQMEAKTPDSTPMKIMGIDTVDPVEKKIVDHDYHGNDEYCTFESEKGFRQEQT